MPTPFRSSVLALALSTPVLLGGCAATVVQQHPTTSQTPTGNLVVTPGTALTLMASQSVQLAATNGGAIEAMSWTLEGNDPRAGAVTPSGLFTAPAFVTSNQAVISGVSITHPNASVSVQITLSNPRPTTTSLSPSTAAANTPYSGTITGANFTPDTIVLVNGTSVSASLVTNTSIQFVTGISGPGGSSLNVQVVTPLPGGGTSANLMLPVVAGGMSYDAAARFLMQASWGATPDSVAHVQQVGFSKYIDEQIALPADSLVTDTDFLHVYENVYNNGLYRPSQLRQKMMWTWYKLLNTPGGTKLAWLSSSPEQLQRDAFANYTTLLLDASLETSNALALSNIANTAGPNPNQNFGRELMQLFSVGPAALNPDGSAVLDSTGNAVPEYTQTDVTEMARAMTGWVGSPSFDTDVEGVTQIVPSPTPSDHDSGDKTVMGTLIPGGTSAYSDMSAVVTMLTNKPNTAAFMSLRLIHALVTSNPTPAYVSRVSSVWMDDGSTTRGNVAAVVKAILLDPEARAGDDPTFVPDPNQGRAMDAVEFQISANRVLATQGQIAGMSWAAGCQMNECVFDAPSVFGYYISTYTLPGTNTLAPELSLFTAAALQTKANYLSNVMSPTADTPISVDFTSWTALATGDGSKLIDAINHLCLHGTMSAGLRSVLAQAFAEVPADNHNSQAKRLLYLTFMSPEYAVIR